MTIFRQDVAQHLEYGIRTGFLKGMKAYVPLRTPFTRETASTGKDEDYADLGVVPMPTETLDVPTIKGLHEVKLTITNRDWDLTVGITHNAINDDRTGDLDMWARQAGRQFERHKDKRCFQALNGGDGTTYGLCYDGQNFFSNSHTDAGAEYTTAQDNLNALTLSIDNYETVEVASNNFVDGRGEYTGFMYDLIVGAPALKRTIAQITDNEWAYDTANNERNPYQGTKGLISPYFDATAWVLVASQEEAKPIILQIRQEPMLDVWDDLMAAEGGVRYYRWFARYDVGYGDWRLANMGNT